jgi:hypothetical protein
VNRPKAITLQEITYNAQHFLNSLRFMAIVLKHNCTYLRYISVNNYIQLKFIFFPIYKFYILSIYIIYVHIIILIISIFFTIIYTQYYDFKYKKKQLCICIQTSCFNLLSKIILPQQLEISM